MPLIESRNQVLIIDRDVAGMEPLRQRLYDVGFAVRVITDVHAAVTTLCTRPPDLLVIDWDVPGMAAYQVISNIRGLRLPKATRMIVVSALSGDDHIVAALSLGADDYLIKPFSVREVAARVARLLRNGPKSCQGGMVNIDGLELDIVANRISSQGVSLDLRRTECRLLEFLMMHSGRTFSRLQLLQQVWGGDVDVDERTVDVNVQRLRKILAAGGYDTCLQTVRGVGYRFSASSRTAVPTALAQS